MTGGCPVSLHWPGKCAACGRRAAGPTGACEAGDGSGFADVYGKLVAFVRSHGRKVGDDDLRGSDIILPPPDLSVEEARVAFQGEGLIPG